MGQQQSYHNGYDHGFVDGHHYEQARHYRARGAQIDAQRCAVQADTARIVSPLPHQFLT